MAKWEKPPRPDHELLKEWLDTNVQGFSAAYDKNKKLQGLEIEQMGDEELAGLMAKLQTMFPQGFA